MVTIQATYDGQLRCTAIHEPSECKLATDAPKDNQGLGQSFSPTDLVATALITCKLTIMGIVAKREGMALETLAATAVKGMSADPRRIGSLQVTVRGTGDLSAAQKEQLEHAALNCPVALSVHPDIDRDVTFEWG